MTIVLTGAFVIAGVPEAAAHSEACLHVNLYQVACHTSIYFTSADNSPGLKQFTEWFLYGIKLHHRYFLRADSPVLETIISGVKPRVALLRLTELYVVTTQRTEQARKKAEDETSSSAAYLMLDQRQFA